MDAEMVTRAMATIRSFCFNHPNNCDGCPFTDYCNELVTPPELWDLKDNVPLLETSNEEEEDKMPTTLLGKDLKTYTDAELDILKEKLKEISEQIIEIKEERRKNKRTELVKQFKDAFTNLQEADIKVSVYRKFSTGLIDCINFDEFSFDDYSEN